MKQFNLEIITPEKVAYKAEVAAITLPGTKGEFQVLFNHTPLVSTFEIGVVKVIIDEKNEIAFATSGGSVEIKDNHVLVLADTLEKPEQIDIDRAKDSAERARKRLASEKKEEIDTARAEASLTRAVNRLKIAKTF
ncbi:MAG TPA: F0F1 ATP synthase subunit epsilon [Ignavibacteriaceae bacterium]|jgi:F-type H+-transporting ATPase subunit epsilon|nr:F0F1 ATP synthase subunit epsilon [Ignavibacteriaceae bacterium]